MTSAEYWAKREAEALKHYITDEKEYQRQLNDIYSRMLDSCTFQINSFYGKYAAKEGITLAEAKKRVAELDIKAYERKAAQYVKEKNFSAKANEEMRLYNATMKINRLEMLKANIGLELIAGHDELDKFMGGILKGRTMEELERQAGILGTTVRGNVKKANAIVNASFHNATFSDRIWMNQDLLKADLSKLLQSGLIQGRNPRELARQLKQHFKTSTYNAERLMRTELARVQTEAQKQSFIENGIEEYEFIVNGGCCEICEGLKGKHFKVEKMMPGTNAPPMHPNCRCSTAAHEDEDDFEAWLAALEGGMTTEEYEAQKAKVNTSLTNGAPESDIIQSGANYGAWTDKNDPQGKKRNQIAADYYEQVRHRNRGSEINAVAKNTGFTKEDIDKVFAHIFELEHKFADGTVHRFHPDYYMQHSWMRLREGKNIQEHDRILLMHELEEAKIMGTGLDVVYEDAHAKVDKQYNYTEALLEYLKDHDV